MNVGGIRCRQHISLVTTHCSVGSYVIGCESYNQPDITVNPGAFLNPPEVVAKVRLSIGSCFSLTGTNLCLALLA